MTSAVYTDGHPLTSQYTTFSLFEYTPGLGVLKETAGCPLQSPWVVLKIIKSDPGIEFWAPEGKKMKNNVFLHFTGTIFIIWMKLARPQYLPFNGHYILLYNMSPKYEKHMCAVTERLFLSSKDFLLKKIVWLNLMNRFTCWWNHKNPDGCGKGCTLLRAVLALDIVWLWLLLIDC